MSLEKKKKIIIDCIYYAILILGTYFIIKYVAPLFTPFILAFIVAAILRKPTVFISKKSHIPVKLVSLIFVALFYAVLITVVMLLGAQIIIGVKELFFKLPDLFKDSIIPFINSTFSMLEDTISKIDIEYLDDLESTYTQWIKSAEQGITNVSLSAVKSISGYVSEIPSLFAKFILMTIASFFFAVDFDKVIGFIKRILPAKVKSLLHIVKTHMSGTVLIYIRSYSLILSITFAELLIGFLILQVKEPVLIAFLVAIMDILPIVGTGLVIIPWGIIELMLGNIPIGIGLLVLYLVITVIRNTIEPRIVGKQIGLHPLVTLISMTVGLRLLGVIGLFGFPVVLSLLVHLKSLEIPNVLNKTEHKEENPEDHVTEKQEE